MKNDEKEGVTKFISVENSGQNMREARATRTSAFSALYSRQCCINSTVRLGCITLLRLNRAVSMPTHPVSNGSPIHLFEFRSKLRGYLGPESVQELEHLPDVVFVTVVLREGQSNELILCYPLSS